MAWSLARSQGMGSCSNGCGNCPERSLMEGTRSPDSSVRRFLGAPASVVDLQRSGSNLLGVAQWQIIRMGRYGRWEKMSHQPRDCILRTSFWREAKPLGKDVKWEKSAFCSSRSA
eukprot:6182143-Pleurochrysis_carterae.AAC.2